MMKAFLSAFVFVLVFSFGAHAQNDPELQKKRAAEIGLRPGMVLEQANAQLAKDLLPEEILRHYEKGEYRNEIVDWPLGGAAMGPEFDAQTKRNAETLDLDDKGAIVDRGTKKQPAYIFGTPFPTIDPKDPNAGIKVVWNYFYNYYWSGNSRNLVDLVWLNPGGVDRAAGQDVYFKYYDGAPPDFRPKDNPNNLLSQLLAATVSPADLYGTVALAWRYRDPGKRDSAWAYVPALRRVRSLSPANRSDGFLGSDMSQDDGPFFDGNPTDFTWKLVGEREVLRMTDPYRLAGDYKTIPLAEGGWRGVLKPLPHYGFQDPGWKGVPWAPVAIKLARRHVWVVEGVPKDRYYLYGKLELWIDEEGYQGTYNRKFGWQGELLNTEQVSGGPPRPTPDGKYNSPSGLGVGVVTQIAENLKMGRATVAGINPGENVPNDRYIKLDPSFFDYQTLYRFGK